MQKKCLITLFFICQCIVLIQTSETLRWEHTCNCIGSQQIFMTSSGSCVCLDCTAANLPGYSLRHGFCTRQLRPFHIDLREKTRVTSTYLTNNTVSGGGQLFNDLSEADTVYGGTDQFNFRTRTRLSNYTYLNKNSPISCANNDSKPSVNYFFSVPVDVISSELFTPHQTVQQTCTDVRAYHVNDPPPLGGVWNLTNNGPVVYLKNTLCQGSEKRGGLVGNNQWTCRGVPDISCSNTQSFTRADNAITRNVNWLEYKTGSTYLGCVFRGATAYSWVNSGPDTDKNIVFTGNTRMDFYNLGASWVDGLSFYGSCTRGSFDRNSSNSEAETCALCLPGHFCPGGASVPIECNRISCIGGNQTSGCNATHSGACPSETSTTTKHQVKLVQLLQHQVKPVLLLQHQVKLGLLLP